MSTRQNVVDPDTTYFIQDHLAAQQSLVNQESYENKFGLFWADGQESKLEAITYCDSSMPDLFAHHYSVLTNVDDIRALFALKRKGLVVLHVGQEHSFSRLKITQTCFHYLLESADIFRAVKNNILHVGHRTTELEIAPPAPSLRFLYDIEGPNSPVCGVEIAYGLRFIELNGRKDCNPWSIRQCVVYNKTHHTNDISQWMFFCLPKVLREQVDHSIGKFQRKLVARPFDIHLMMFSTVIAMWRPYFVHIVQEIESCRIQVNMSDPRNEDYTKNVQEDTFLVLKDYETDMLDAMLAIRATKRTLTHHQNTWEKWCASQRASSIEMDAFAYDLRFSELSQNLDGVLDQAQSLLNKIRSTSEIVASFLALASSYSAEKTAEQSRCLAELSQIDSSRMKILTETAQKDTKAVKALSVVTLIYLPITVVLNFFSTSFVSDNHGSVQIVGRWWLLIATSIPLTMLTLVVWGVWIYRQNLGQTMGQKLKQRARSPPLDPEVGISPTMTLVGSASAPGSPMKA